jgi:hypothetical protein
MLPAQYQLSDLGFAVFPCVPNGKRPLTGHGLLDATTDETKIAEWSAKWPNANWAIRTDGLLVVDVDGADNEWFHSLGEKARELATAHVSITPRGGRHFVFRQPDGAHYGNSQGVIGHHVDTRANGGYIVVAPSVVDGKPYKWLTDLDIGPAGLPLPPSWILELLAPRGQAGSSPRNDKPQTANKIPDGLRNKTLFSLGCGMRRAGMSHDAIYAALSQENATRCNPPLDEREVGQIAGSCAKYSADWQAVSQVEHFGEQVFAAAEEDESRYFVGDPGPLSPELLRVPGFISEVMDFCLHTAPYPNEALAFCGALCLQAFLAARKVCDYRDNRTSLYALALANSATGKDWPRKLNAKICAAVGLQDRIGDAFASAEGLQDALAAQPSMLFQTDEIDGLLQSMNRASKDARYQNLETALLTLFGASSGMLPIRRKAGDGKNKKDRQGGDVIKQPSLTLFGTAIPDHYFSALSDRMLTNGLFARFVIIEAGKRQRFQDTPITELPASILETARYWAEWHGKRGNLDEANPQPVIVEYTDTARRLKLDCVSWVDDEFAKYEQAGDRAAMAVWGRVNEAAHKLALIYAVSERPLNPIITDAAFTWAASVSTHLAKRMLYMASLHVSDNPFHKLQQKFKRILAASKNKQASRSSLLRRMHVDSQQLEKVARALLEQGDIANEQQATAGAPLTVYRLLGS